MDDPNVDDIRDVNGEDVAMPKPEAQQDAEVMRALVTSVLQKTYYGHTVSEVLALAVALETAIDSTLVKALIKNDAATIELVNQKLLGQLGRERKFDLLRSILQAEAVADVEPLCKRIRNLFDLRDKIAHGAVMEISANEYRLHLVGYRRGKTQAHELTAQAVSMALEDGQNALQDLMPYAVA